VNHTILIDKLERLGYRGKCLNLLKSYILNRKQFTSQGPAVSPTEDILRGVAQGSILSPLLFALFINDLETASSGFITMFADDTCILYSARSPYLLRGKIKEDITLINQWLILNCLTLNEKKTQILEFNSPRSSATDPFTINNSAILPSTTAKYLGIILDNKLSGIPHTEHIATKLASATAAIINIKKFIGHSLSKLLYNAYFLSHLNYGIEFWGYAPATAIAPIQKAQNRVVRIINPQNSASRDTFFRLQILKIAPLTALRSTTLVKLILSNRYPPILDLRPGGSSIQTRARPNHTLIIPALSRNNSTLAEKVSSVWNKLPATIKAKESINSFKRMVTSLYLDKQTTKSHFVYTPHILS
jgi:hypothetical protein